MVDLVDPKFKLFGKTIPLPSDSDEVSGESVEIFSSNSKLIAQEIDAENESDKLLEDEKSTDDPCPRVSDEKDDQTQKDQEKTEVEESKNSSLKKPDKIIACPRCNSMDTKFCYYNNYNVHQPRHFCKSCQRYWTAGGTMRNVPVGAGRRKNKSSSSSKYCHISISDALNGVQTHHQQPAGLQMNGTLLTFGSDSIPSEPIVNLAEKKILNSKSRENGDDRSSGSSTVTTTSGSVEGDGGNMKHQTACNVNGYTSHHQVPFFPGFQLAYGWNPAIPMPPISFYPAPFWNGHWVAPCPMTPKSQTLSSSSPTLGKHSRDEYASIEPEKRSSSSSHVLLPKTLRIDNPEEAAKSSIWNTLGIKKVETVSASGFFKGLQSKVEEKKRKLDSCPLLNANPAALARSIGFQETA